MKKNLNISVNSKEFQLEYDSETDLYIIDGKSYSIKELNKFSNKVNSLSINNENMIYSFAKSEDSSKIRLENFDYDVKIQTSEIAQFEKLMLVKSDSKSKGGIIKAPMPGLVVKVNIQLGDIIKKGDKLLSLEAMKMENSISSPVAGKVIAVNVVEGDTVEKDKVMLELE